MPKAIDVANELHLLADSIANGGEIEINRPSVYCSYMYEYSDDTKQKFVSFVKLLPKPLKKKYDGSELDVRYETDNLLVRAYIERSKVCEIVVPAKEAVYKCSALFGDDEAEDLVRESGEEV